MKTIKEYHYQGYFSCESKCRLDIDKARSLVIATELCDNPGTSITNMAEDLANEVCEKYDIAKAKLIWLERYNKESYKGESAGFNDCNLSLVIFELEGGKFKNPEWKHLDKEDKLYKELVS